MLPMLANTITADMGLIPGFAFVGPAMGLPLSVLASIIERPFYSHGGLASNAVWYSLQANLVSLSLGFILLLVFGGLTSAVGLGASDEAFFLIWPILAIALSSVIERHYIAARAPSQTLSWGWSITANIVSAAVCIAVLLVVPWLRDYHPALVAVLRPYEFLLKLVAGIGSGVTFIVAFAATHDRVDHGVRREGNSR